MTRYCYRNLNNTSCRNGSAVLQDGLDRRPALAAHAYTVLLPSAGTAAVLAAAVLAAEQAEGAAAVVYPLNLYGRLHALPQRTLLACNGREDCTGRAREMRGWAVQKRGHASPITSQSRILHTCMAHLPALPASTAIA